MSFAKLMPAAGIAHEAAELGDGRNRGVTSGVTVLLGSTRVISVTPQTDVPPKPVKVLFVEDEVLLRLMMADMLREEGRRRHTSTRDHAESGLE